MISGNLKVEFKNLAIQSLFLPHFSVTGYSAMKLAFLSLKPIEYVI